MTWVRKITVCAPRVRKLTVTFERPVKFLPRILKVTDK